MSALMVHFNIDEPLHMVQIVACINISRYIGEREREIVRRMHESTRKAPTVQS